jgi:GNAT superfamily N-acetyltransferase
MFIAGRNKKISQRINAAPTHLVMPATLFVIPAKAGISHQKNMTIEYKNTHEFSEQDLKDLFLSVEWSSGHFPDKLVVAMKNFKTVISAWDGDKLVGMICAMDDGIMNAYVHYLLVRPEYQGKCIGKVLVDKVHEIYKDYLRIVVVAYNEEIAFYEHCGFKKADDASPMFITSLWT